MTKGGNRTKGNTKPSSSAKAFNLFLKYNGSNEQATFFDLENYSDLTDESNHEIFIAIRKCYKKDIVTKMKGLKDILELFTNNKDEDYSFLLKHWIKLFINLVNEDDIQVREVTLSTFEQINKLVKAQLKPYLKQIVPLWLCLAGDQYGNVSKYANQAFKSTFGKNKLNEVFLFCKEQIISNISTILFNTNYNEKKNAIRLLPCVFYSTVVLSKIAKDDEYLNNEFIKLLDNEKFWEYSKFSDKIVQISWFNLISSMLENKFHLMKKHLKKIYEYTYDQLDEKNISLKESVWNVIFLLMKLDKESFDLLNYDKIYQSIYNLIKDDSSFNSELLIENFDLILKYFLFKNEKKQELVDKLFHLLQQEILAKKDRTLAIDLYFRSLIYLIKNPQYCNQDFLDELMNQKLETIIEKLLSDNKRLQVLFEKLVNFLLNLKYLKCDHQVCQVNDLILKTVRKKLDLRTENDEFDSQSMKTLLNIIFNLKSYQSRNKLSLHSSDCIESLEFSKYKFHFNEKTDDGSTKKDLFREVLAVIFIYSNKNFKVSLSYIEFLNYLIQFSNFLNIIDGEEILIEHLKIVDQQIIGNKILKIKLIHVIQQMILQSNRKIFLKEILDLNCSMNAFSFIFTMQLFKDDHRVFLITEYIPSIFEVLFNEFSNFRPSNNIENKNSISEIDLEDEHDSSKENKLIRLLTHETELNLLNAIYSLLNLKLDDSFYRNIFYKLISLNCNVHILIYLIFDQLKIKNKVLSAKTIEILIFNFIEFTYQSFSSELDRNLWSDVLFNSLKQNEDQLIDILMNLSSKFKQLLISKKLTTFDHLNLIISHIYLFATKLSTLNSRYSNSELLDKILKNILLKADEFEKFEHELNKQILEFLWIKNDLIDYDFSKKNHTQDDTLSIPHLAHVTYASLKISKLINFFNEQLDFENLMSDSSDLQISNLLTTNIEFKYLFHYSNLSYCYLKILDQIYSYDMISTNSCDVAKCYIYFYEQLYIKLDKEFVKKYANNIYESNQGNIWTITSLNYLLKIVNITDTVFDFKTISKSLEINNFCLIRKYLSNEDLESFLEQLIQYNLTSKPNYPENFEDIKEYLNIITICLKNFQLVINQEKNLLPIIDTILNYQDKVLSKEKENLLYFDESSEKLMNQLKDPNFINTIVSIISFLDQFIRRCGDDLNPKLSNFLFYSLLKWTEILNADINHLLNNHLCNYYNRLFNLINSVSFLLQLNFPNMKKTISNWFENYSFKINERLFKFYLKLSKQEEIKFVHFDMINTLGKCLIQIDNDCLMRTQFRDIDLDQFNDWKPSEKNFSLDDDSVNIKMSTKLERLFNLLASLLMKRSSLYWLTSYQLIKNYLHYLANELNHDLEFLTVIGEKLYLKPPKFLCYLLDKVNEEIRQNNLVFNEQINSLKIIYLLLWDQLLEFWSELDSQIQAVLANYLKDRGAINDLFNHLNDILPIDKKSLEVYYKNGLTKIKIKEYFSKPLNFESASLWSVSTLYHFSCQIYLKIFIKMPTTMRLWINTSINQSQIRQFTLNFVSEIVIKNELKMIQDKAFNNLENLKLKVRQSTNEVLAFYSFEDCKIELALTIPNNYPIGLILINAGERVGVDVSKWRAWELQLHTFLAHNGSVFDGIVLWLNNIKKTLEYCEECMICFYVLQSSNYQLPKVMCKNCRKKFHRVCLSKWFTKSNKRLCPLCRNEM